MHLNKILLQLLSLFSLGACAVLPVPTGDDFPLDQKIAGTDTGCPKLTGTYAQTPSLSTLSEGHPPRFEGRPYDYVNLFMFGFIEDDKKSLFKLVEPPLKMSDFLLRIIESDDQFLVDSVYGDGSKINRHDITALISRGCGSDGTKWMLVDDNVGSSEGVRFNSRWLRKVAKAVNGDLLVYVVITNAKPTMRADVAEHYLFRFKTVSAKPEIEN
jgi:hypothetical protein